MASVPRYQKLKQLLHEKLQSGDYKVGDRFPSQNELMKRYSLSFATVTRAMNELENEGLLRREQGRGSFVRAIPVGPPNPHQDALRVRVFIPWDARSPAHINFQRLYSSLENSRTSHTHLTMIPYGSDAAEMDRYLFSREPFDGAIIVYPDEQHLPFVTQLARTCPTVVVGRCIEDTSASCVYTDNRAAAQQAVKYLLEQGHTQIGMISGGLEMTDARERLDGYQDALRAAGIRYLDTMVVYTHPLELNGYGATLELFDKNSSHEVTAIFAAGDILALGALSALRSMGKKIPQDVSVMGFDDIQGAGELDPPLTTMHVPMEEIAENAMTLLVELIAGRRARTKQLDARLEVRSSTQSIAIGFRQQESTAAPALPTSK